MLWKETGAASKRGAAVPVYCLVIMISATVALSLLTGFGVQEGGKPEVTVQRFAHAATCPVRCKTCAPAIARALDFLARNMKSEGLEAGNGGDVVVTCIAGLAFMANGVHADKVEKAAQFVAKRVGEKSRVRTAAGEELEGFGNWDLAFAGLFLAEVYAARPTPDLEKKLRVIAQKICEQRQENGGWGHAKDYAYGDLVVVTNACLAALGAMKMVRIPVPDDVITKGVKYLESTSDGGVVGYSPRAGQRGWGHAGRASGAAYAMLRCGATGAYYKRVAAFVKSNVKTVPQDHASPTLHYLMSGLFTYMLGLEAWRDYRTHYLDLWLSAQKDDGRFQCPTESDLEARGDKDMDEAVGANYMTAVFALVYALPLERTNLTRTSLRGGRAPKPEKPVPTAADVPKEPTNAYLGLVVRESRFGLTVASVEPGSPGDAAGFRIDAVIVEVNGRTVKDPASLRDALNAIKPGTKATFTVADEGERKTLTATPVKRAKPAESAEEF